MQHKKDSTPAKSERSMERQQTDPYVERYMRENGIKPIASEQQQ